MRFQRLILLGLLATGLLGSLSVSGGYAWYLRSDAYRRASATALGESLQLPAEIGGVLPRSTRSREFEDVRVWLPDRRDVALFCRQALVIYRPTPADPDAYALELNDGRCEISTRTWLRQDYRRVVESSLRPGFAEGGPQRVSFTDMDLILARDRFRLRLEGASGSVDFSDALVGHAAAFCHLFNGRLSNDPVSLVATFSPHDSGVRMDRVELSVPRMELSSVGLADLIQADVRSGWFHGQLVYAENETGKTLTVSGRLTDVDLQELAAAFFPGPLYGRCSELELQELRVENQAPTRIRFRGVLSDVATGDLLAPLGLAQVGGQAVLRVREADISQAGIERFIASGRCDNVSLEALTAGLGLQGRMSGIARVVIGDLTIEQNRLVSLDADVRIDEQASGPRWIEGELLRDLVSRALNLTLPPVLPERIDYTHLGLRMQVRNERLHIFGTHGKGEKTILTVLLFDRETPLVNEPANPFDLAPWLDMLRSQAAERLRTRFEQYIRRSAEPRPPSNAPPVAPGPE